MPPPPHAAHDTSPPPPRRYTRPAVSCLPCRARKVRCDRQRACGHCRRRGEECLWPPEPSIRRREWREPLYGESSTARATPERRQPAADGIDRQLKEMQTRLMRMEQLVVQSRTTEAYDDDLVSSSPSQHQIDSPPDVQGLDDFDHQIISSKRGRQVRGEPAIEEAQRFTQDRHDRVRAHFMRLWNKLPSRVHLDRLLDVYFERVEWIHHIIHRPSFCNWLEQHRTATADLVQIDLHSIALLFIMLCLAIHFDRHHVDTHDEWTAQRYYQISLDALEAGDYLDNHSIAAIQTLIMHGLWLNDHSKSDRHHANLAVAIRMANGLGMARLDMRGGEAGADDGLDAEMARRIYWSLYCQDSYTASSCSFTYLIQPSQMRIYKPANVADDEVGRRRHSSANLDDTRTTMSYHVAKIVFADLTRQHVDLYSVSDGQLRYDDALALERKFCNAYQSLPSYLQHPHRCSDDSDDSHDVLLNKSLYWQALFMEITLHNRIIRLHRPFVMRAYDGQGAYAHARSAVLSSAQALLRLMAEGQSLAFPGLHWWVVRIHTFTAGIICCVAMLHDGHHGAQREELTAHVRQAIAILSDGAQRSRAAHRAAGVLETLFQQTLRGVAGTTRSTPSQRQRRYDDTATVPASITTAPIANQTSPSDLSAAVTAYSISPPYGDAEEASSVIPTIDWGSLFDPISADLRHDADQSLAEVIHAFWMPSSQTTL